MHEEFDVVVIGAGMMGSAAARHLARVGASVALIGPDEPRDRSSHTGVFASHYDEARITRALDSSSDWSRLAMRSIARYRDIEAKAGRRFFHDIGAMMAGPEEGPLAGFVRDVLEVGKTNAIDFQSLSGEGLARRFPCFRFPRGILALYEPRGAGYINPRAHVTAEIGAAVLDGAVLIREEVREIHENSSGVTVYCADGRTCSAEKVIVACGGFSAAAGLLPSALPMKVYARTVVFFELDDAEAQRLTDMPSLVYVPPDQSCEPYVLPPVRYPDGRVYLKIGGDPTDVELETPSDVKDWFRGTGSAEVRDFLSDALMTFMPDLRYRAISSDSCVTSYTSTGKPLIYSQSQRIIALTGGNGAGAKCADELGHIGACLALGGPIDAGLYQTDFGLEA